MKHTIFTFVALLLAPLAAFAASPLLDVFPASKAPTFYQKPSGFVVSRQFRPGSSRSQWAEGVDERAVFHACRILFSQKSLFLREENTS